MDISPFPASERLLCLFVSFLFNEKLSYQTVKGYLAAVRQAQIATGLGDPRIASMPQLEYVIKGLRRLGNRRQTTRLPITPSLLLLLRAAWERLPSKFDAIMLWAAACMCFFGFLRSGEVVVPSDSSFDQQVHLAFGDVRVNDVSAPSFLVVTLKASKTDPFRLGVSVYLGKTDQPLCPIAAVLAYMVARGDREGAFFHFADGRLLTRTRFVTAVRAALTEQGVDARRYSGHSFRIGAATTAAARGIPDHLIKIMGRWESAAYQLYV